MNHKIAFLVALALGLGGCKREPNNSIYSGAKVSVRVTFSDGGTAFFSGLSISTNGVVNVPKPGRIEYEQTSYRDIP